MISTDKIETDTSKNRGIAHEEDGGSVGIANGMAWDDLTGATLDPREVSKARLKVKGKVERVALHQRQVCV